MANKPDLELHVSVTDDGRAVERAVALSTVLKAAEEASKAWGTRNVGRRPSQGTDHVEGILLGPMLKLAQAIDDWKDERPSEPDDDEVLGEPRPLGKVWATDMNGKPLDDGAPTQSVSINEMRVNIRGSEYPLVQLIITEDGLLQPDGYFSKDGGKTSSYPAVGHQWFPGRPPFNPRGGDWIGKDVVYQGAVWGVIDWNPFKDQYSLHRRNSAESDYRVVSRREFELFIEPEMHKDKLVVIDSLAADPSAKTAGKYVEPDDVSLVGKKVQHAGDAWHIEEYDPQKKIYTLVLCGDESCKAYVEEDDFTMIDASRFAERPDPTQRLGQLVRWMDEAWRAIEYDTLSDKYTLAPTVGGRSRQVSRLRLEATGYWLQESDASRAAVEGDKREGEALSDLPGDASVGKVDAQGRNAHGYFSGDGGLTSRVPQPGDVFYTGSPERPYPVGLKVEYQGQPWHVHGYDVQSHCYLLTAIDAPGIRTAVQRSHNGMLKVLGQWDWQKPQDRLGDYVMYRGVEWLVTEWVEASNEYVLTNRYSLRLDDTTRVSQAVLEREAVVSRTNSGRSFIGEMRWRYRFEDWFVVAYDAERDEYTLRHAEDATRTHLVTRVTFESEAYPAAMPQHASKEIKRLQHQLAEATRRMKEAEHKLADYEGKPLLFSQRQRLAELEKQNQEVAKRVVDHLEDFYKQLTAAQKRWMECECQHCVGAASMAVGNPDEVWRAQGKCSLYRELQMLRRQKRALENEQTHELIEPKDDDEDYDEPLKNAVQGVEKRTYDPLDPRSLGVKGDPIRHPSHYTHGKFEPLDVIEDWKLGFNLGNALKYVCRADHKGSVVEDLKKARFYLDREIQLLQQMVDKGYEVNPDSNPSGESPPIDCGTFKLDPNRKYKTLEQRIADALKTVLDERLPKTSMLVVTPEQREKLKEWYRMNLAPRVHEPSKEQKLAELQSALAKLRVERGANLGWIDIPSSLTPDGGFEINGEIITLETLGLEFLEKLVVKPENIILLVSAARRMLRLVTPAMGGYQGTTVRLCKPDPVINEWVPTDDREAKGAAMCAFDDASKKWMPLPTAQSERAHIAQFYTERGNARAAAAQQAEERNGVYLCDKNKDGEYEPIENAAAIDGGTMCQYDNATLKWVPLKADPCADTRMPDGDPRYATGTIESGSSS